MPMFRLNLESFRGDPRYAQWAHRAQSQPSWVLRWAIFAALLVVVIPVALLLLAAAATFVLVFVGLSLAHRISNWLRRILGMPADGRRNVRVIRVE